MRAQAPDARLALFVSLRTAYQMITGVAEIMTVLSVLQTPACLSKPTEAPTINGPIQITVVPKKKQTLITHK